MARAASSREITPAASMRAEHVIARALCGRGKAIRTAHLGRLRNGDQQGRFAHRQPPRLLAEIGERGRAHAFQVAAERRQPEIEPQDLVLRQPPVELQRQQRLADLADQGFLVHAQQQPRHLHGDGRAARQRAPVAQQQPSGPCRPPADRRRDGGGSACPRRRSAWRGSAGRPPSPPPAGASGRRARCRRAAAGRCGRAP